MRIFRKLVSGMLIIALTLISCFFSNPITVNAATQVTATDMKLEAWYELNKIVLTTAINQPSKLNKNTALDSSGNGNVSLNYSSTLDANGDILFPSLDINEGNDGAYRFDGLATGVKLSLGSTPPTFLHDAFSKKTVSIRFKAASVSGIQYLYEQGGPSAGLAIRINNGYVQAGIAGGSPVARNSAQSKSTIAIDTWYTAIAVYSGDGSASTTSGNLSLYLFGDSLAEAQQGLQNSTACAAKVVAAANDGGIGQRFGNNDAFSYTTNEFFNGWIDDVKVYKDVAAVPTNAIAPIITSLTPGHGSASLSWNPVAGATKYYIAYKKDSDTAYKFADVGTDTSGKVTGLDGETQYQFKVLSSSNGYLMDSAPQTAVTDTYSVDTPVLQAAQAGYTQVQLNWSSVPNAAKYILKYGTSPGVYSQTVDCSTSTSYMCNGLTNETTYYFAVYAQGVDGIPSDDSNEKQATPSESKILPTQLVSVSTGHSKLTPQWTSVTGAVYYRVYYGTSTDSYTDHYDTVGAVTSCNINGLINDTVYYVSVQACSQTAGSILSNEISSMPSGVDLVAPVLSAPVAGIEKVGLSWSTVPGAASYTIKYGKSPGTYSNTINSVTQTVYEVAYLDAEARYYFTVCAVYGINVSDPSNEVDTVTLKKAALSAPVLNTPVSSTDKVTLSWNPVVGASKYKIMMGTASGQYTTMVDDIVATSYDFSNLQTGTKYYFAVKVTGDEVDSPMSNEVTAYRLKTPTLSTPVLNTPTVGNDSVNLSWNSVSADVYYKVYIGTAAGQYSSVINYVYSTHLNITNLDYGSTCYFSVQAYDGSDESLLSNEVSTSFNGNHTVDAPVINLPAADARKVTLSWNAVEGAQKYKVYVGTAAGQYTDIIDNITATQTDITNLLGGTRYYFVVKAVSGNIESESSLEVNTVTLDSEGLQAPVINAPVAGVEKVTLSWNAVDGAEKYRVYVGTAPGQYTDIIDNITATQTDITNLLGGTTYYFAVKAIKGSEESQLSSEVNVYVLKKSTGSHSGGSADGADSGNSTTPSENNNTEIVDGKSVKFEAVADNGKVKVAASMIDKSLILSEDDNIVKNLENESVSNSDNSLNAYSESTLNVDYQTGKDVDEVEVGFPLDVLKSLSDKGLKNVAFETDLGKILFPITAVNPDTADSVLFTINKDTAANSQGNVIYNISLFAQSKTSELKEINKFNDAIRIGIPYVPKSNENVEKVTVVYNGDDGRVQNMAGRFDSKTQKVWFSTNHLSKYSVVYNNVEFGDIADSWAKNYIEVMAAKGIVNGKDSTSTFKAEDSITRAEFAKMLTTMLGIVDDKAVASFTDVTAEDWYGKYVASAVRAGLVLGNADGSFAPDDVITREDMAVMIYRAIANGKTKSLSDLSSFSDSNEIEQYSKEAFAATVDYGLILGKSNSLLDPKGVTTRGEAATIIYRLYNLVR